MAIFMKQCRFLVLYMRRDGATCSIHNRDRNSYYGDGKVKNITRSSNRRICYLLDKYALNKDFNFYGDVMRFSGRFVDKIE